MLVRTVVGVICVPLMLAVLFLCPTWALPCLYALLGALAQHELLWTTGFVKNRLLLGLCALSAAAVPFLLYFHCEPAVWMALCTGLVLAFFLIAMNTHHTISFPILSTALFSALVVPLFLGQAISIRNADNGVYLIVLPFLAAWMSDTGAYFIGSFFGHHKLCPNISPKKSVEGAFGGVLGALVGGAVYALIMVHCFEFSVNYAALAVICAVGSAVGQLGDLIFSYIKREVGIKDYGKLFPGHGGVLDRFDSIFLTTPVTAVLLTLLPSILR